MFKIPENSPIIKEIKFFKMNSYSDICSRDVVGNISYENIDKIDTIINKGTLVEPFCVSKINPDVLRYSEETRDAVIDNGWESERYSFMIKTEHSHNGINIVTIVLGFTDDNTINDRTLLYINSVAEYTVDNFKEPTHVRNMKNYQIISSSDKETKLKTCRPEDIIRAINAKNTFTADYTDIRNDSSIIPINSKFRNNILSHSTSELLNAIILDYEMNKISMGSIDNLNTAICSLVEGQIFENHFLNTLGILSGTIIVNTLTLDLLNNINTDIKDIVEIIDVAPLFHGSFSTLKDGSKNSKIAYALNETLQSLMFETSIRSLDIDFDTRDHAITLNNIKGFFGDLYHVDELLLMLKSIIIPSITNNNYVRVKAKIKMNLLGESIFSIGIDDGEYIAYKLPTFGTSTYSSILISENNFDNLVEEYSYIINLLL